MATTTRLLTVEEYGNLPDEDGVQHELVEGVLVEMPTAKPGCGLLMELIGNLLAAYVREHPLGYILRDNNGFVLQRTPDTVRISDIAYVQRERLLSINVWEDYISGAHDLAVEIVSPSDRANAVRAKARESIAAGSQLVWIVWPKTRTLTVYTLDDEPREYGADDMLDGGNVLPGFSVRVRDLFDLPRIAQ